MMNTPLTIEEKGKRIEKIATVAAMTGICLILGPLLGIILHGLAALTFIGIACVIGFGVVNFAPAFGYWIANKKVAALKAIAAADPIGTLENLYRVKMEALNKTRDTLQEFNGLLIGLWDKIKEHDKKFPNTPSSNREKYNAMKQLYAVRSENYKKAYAKLGEFRETLDEKRDDWEITVGLLKADKLAKAGEDFNAKLMEDTALRTVTNGLNTAFAALDMSLLDEQAATAASGATVVISSPAPSRRLAAPKDAPPIFDLEPVVEKVLIQK